MHSLDERPHDAGYDFWTEIIGALSSLSLEYKKRQKKEKKSLEMFRVFIHYVCLSLFRVLCLKKMILRTTTKGVQNNTY